MSSKRMSRLSGGSSHKSTDGELMLECKAAYLSIYGDIQEDIESRDQLESVLQQTGRNPTEKMLRKYWSPSTDCLSFDDFVDICKRESCTTTDDLMKAFKKIDTNGDGYISREELYDMLTERGERMTMDEVKQLIDEVDENRDGRLDYSEFCNMVMSTANECKKMSKKIMEKKEKKKQKISSRKVEASPRSQHRTLPFEQYEIGMTGSQLSLRSNLSTPPRETDKQGQTWPTHKDKVVCKPFQRKTKTSNVDIFSTPNRKCLSDSSYPVAAPRTSLTLKCSPTNQDKVTKGDMTAPKPAARKRTDDRPRSPVSGRKARLPEPKNLKEWTHLMSKGCFFLEDDASLVSHQFTLHLPSDSNVWITIQPYKPGSASSRDTAKPVDTCLYILRERTDSSGQNLISFTDHRDSRGKYGVRCDLPAGNYILAPMTTGCRLKPRRSEPKSEAKLVKKDKDGKIVLSKAFRKALEEIFEISDLDGNGSLSREEFNLFNLRTSGEEVGDDLWTVVEDTVKLVDGEIIMPGFLHLNEMEAQDNDGDTEDSWITLSNMGFNKDLLLDEACPFRVDVYTEDSDHARLVVRGLEAGSIQLENAVCNSVIQKGESMKMRGLKDVTMYTYVGDSRATAVLENKSHNKVKVLVDCSKSRNVVSSKGNLIHTVDLHARSMMVAHHLIPDDEKNEWSVKFGEPVAK